MRKFLALLILILTLLIATAPFANANFLGAKVNAETIVTNRLEYFELDKPLAVDRDGDRVFIAQKDMLIIYHDETYDKITVEGGDITYLEKCGNHLLFLNAGSVYSLNLATSEISTALFNNVSSFSVSGNFFAINQGSKIRFFELSDAENFLFNEVSASYITGEIVILNQSPALALAPDLTFYYFVTDTGTVQDMNSSGRQGHTFEKTFNSLEQLFFDSENQILYFKSGDVIYRYLLDKKQLESILDLQKENMQNAGKFCVDNNRLLICDTFADRVVEYDLQTFSTTGFEISFTKINLPSDFGVSYDEKPYYVTVKQGEKLYDINLNLSTQKGYFLFNGYHEQKQSANYLIVKEINDIFYLISGDCFALVLKENYVKTAVTLTQKSNLYGYMTNDGKVYKYPKLLPEFLSFEFEKHEKVQITHTLEFNGISYAIIKKGEESGFIPTSFILDTIYVAPGHKSFTTATTKRTATAVYQDKDLSEKTDELEGFSTVIVIEESENCYLIKYNGEKYGYVEKSAIIKRGSYTNKIVFVIILFTLSLTITFIHFELKYLYKRKKTL